MRSALIRRAEERSNGNIRFVLVTLALALLLAFGPFIGG